jgi:hypothetical protein
MDPTTARSISNTLPNGGWGRSEPTMRGNPMGNVPEALRSYLLLES